MSALHVYEVCGGRPPVVAVGVRLPESLPRFRTADLLFGDKQPGMVDGPPLPSWQKDELHEAMVERCYANKKADVGKQHAS